MTEASSPPVTLAPGAFLVSLSLLPVWYEWDGKHWPAKSPHYGLDCSGAVCCDLEARGLIPVGYRIRARDLADECAPIAEADVIAGDLKFYRKGGAKGQGPITHVMLVLDAQRMIGAAGGGSTTTSITVAQKQRACVKIVDRSVYRPADVVCSGRFRPHAL